MQIQDCASICYAACRVASIAAGSDVPAWGRARAEEKAWMRFRIQCILKAPDSALSIRHGFWCEYMVAAGWKLGDLDYAKKTHPHLVDFNKLPDDERFKCQLMTNVALACAASE